MHAIPSPMPLSRTASMTSSVMSRTVRPPVVRSCVSRWKTFTAPILRVRGGYVTGEPSIARDPARGGLAVRLGRRAAPARPADADRPGHALCPVAVHRAVHLVALAGLEGELDRLARAGVDVAALDLVALAAAGLDRQGVRDRAVVRDLEGIGAWLRDLDRARGERVLLLGDLDRLEDGPTGRASLARRAAAAAVAAAGGEQQRDGKEDEQALHARSTRVGCRSDSPVPFRAHRARSSVGQSSELIIRWSLVRVQAGPYAVQSPRDAAVTFGAPPCRRPRGRL